MPNVGDVKYEYGRVYVWVQPDAALGPGTWRVSNQDELAGPGVVYDFDGVAPIDINTITGTLSTPTVVQTSMDIQQLDDRAN